MKIYDINGFDSLVYAVSFVEDPAIEESYVALSKQKTPVVVTMEKDDRHLVVGPALIPDQLIYRRDEYTGEEYYLRFSAESIAQLARRFLAEREVTLDHERFANGAYIAESWIKEDMEKDKSVALGLNPELPVGTWFLTTFVDSQELWEQVKNGRWTGYSVEAWCSIIENDMFKKQNKNKDNEEMNENTLFERIEELFKSYFSKPEVQAEPEAGEEVKLEEEQPAVAEEAEEQAQHDEVVELEEEQPAEEEKPSVETRVAELESQLAEANSRNEQLTARLGEMNAKITELSKQPSAEPVNVKASAETKGDVMDTIRALREGTYFKG